MLTQLVLGWTTLLSGLQLVAPSVTTSKYMRGNQTLRWNYNSPSKPGAAVTCITLPYQNVRADYLTWIHPGLKLVTIVNCIFRPLVTSVSQRSEDQLLADTGDLRDSLDVCIPFLRALLSNVAKSAFNEQLRLMKRVKGLQFLICPSRRGEWGQSLLQLPHFSCVIHTLSLCLLTQGIWTGESTYIIRPYLFYYFSKLWSGCIWWLWFKTEAPQVLPTLAEEKSGFFPSSTHVMQ